MSELEALIGVFGAIDQAVVDGPELTPKVAALLCPYNQGGAAGWYEPFENWVIAHGGAPFPRLEPALAELGGAESQGRSLARRLLAIAALSRVLPHAGAFQPRRETLAGLATGALEVPGLASNLSQAQALMALVSDEEILPDLSAWPAMLERASLLGLISAGVAAQVHAPCDAQMIFVPGNPRPVCALKTHFCTPVATMTYGQAIQFLDPRNWPYCSDLWCAMTPIPGSPGVDHYLEVISLDCKGGGFKLKTCLDFMSFQLPTGDGAMVEYRRSTDQSAGGDGLVTVDEGSIEVRQIGNEVCVSTTKRIQFALFVSAGQLAMIACAAGYSAEGENLVYSCALRGGMKGAFPFQGQELPRREIHVSDQEPSADVGTVIAEGIDLAKGCIADCAGAYKTAYEKAIAGDYTAKDMADDLAKMWTRMLVDGATVADLGARALHSAAAPGGPPPGDPPPGQ